MERKSVPDFLRENGLYVVLIYSADGLCVRFLRVADLRNLIEMVSKQSSTRAFSLGTEPEKVVLECLQSMQGKDFGVVSDEGWDSQTPLHFHCGVPDLDLDNFCLAPNDDLYRVIDRREFIEA